MTEDKVQNLRDALSQKPAFAKFAIWLVGDTPIISHAWSEKTKREMLSKQVKAIKPGKEARDVHADFESSLYEMGEGAYGFPVTAFKNAIISAAHKDKGLAKTAVMAGLWLEADMVRVRPALAGAICDMPLVRIWGSKPEMREDMVRIGVGLNKTSSLAYRAQFTTWAVRLEGKFNETTLKADALASLIQDAGLSYGVGEWRNEKRGLFGSFHLATAAEDLAWTDFAASKGPLPGRETLPTVKLAAE